MRCAALLSALFLLGCSKSSPVSDVQTPALALAAAPTSSSEAVPASRTASSDAPGSPDKATTDAENAQSGGIAWRHGDVDGAFAEARKSNKPVFLYWGAVWCPPCNQVKATIFNRQDFIERSRAFVAVYIDGDAPNAQQLGARFKVSGYPSMLLFRPDGKELTRLPGEVDAQRYMQVLTMGMNSGRPVGETLHTALEGGRGLSEQDWRMLAYYSWATDEQQLVPKDKVPDTLSRLAHACPAAYHDSAERLALEAINAAATATPLSGAGRTNAYPILERALNDPERSRQNLDILTDSVGPTIRYATDANPGKRAVLTRAWDTMLDSASNDTALSQTDRLGAVDGRVELARVAQPKGDLPPPLLAEVRRQVSRADRETTNPYERQSVINAAAATLADAGLLDASDELLKAELSRSHAPYYFMVDLSRNAQTRGDKATAINWLAQAYQSSEGPATRLQWGVLYVRGLIDMTPNDDARIEQVSEAIISELAGNSDLFYERNRSSLAKLGRKIAEWNKSHQHDAVVAGIRAKLGPVCNSATAEPSMRIRCEGFFVEPSPVASS